jgi:hypothetical protein
LEHSELRQPEVKPTSQDCDSDTIGLGEILTWPVLLVQRDCITIDLEISDPQDHNSQNLAKNDNRKKCECDIQHRYRVGRQHGRPPEICRSECRAVTSAVAAL